MTTEIRDKVMAEFGYSKPFPKQWVEVVDAAIEAAVADQELYNKAVTSDWDGRQMLLAIATSREEGRQEERARWLAWAEDLGYTEQELPK